MIRISQDIETEPVSIDDVKQFIKFSDDDGDEISLITDMLKGVRVHIEKMTGLSFAKKTIQEKFEKNNSGIYVLHVAPVISIDSVYSLDIEEEQTKLTLNEDYYASGMYERILKVYGVDTQLKVEYSVGFGDTETEDLPFDLKQAVLRQVIQWYDNRDEYLQATYMDTIGSIIRQYQRKW